MACLFSSYLEILKIINSSLIDALILYLAETLAYINLINRRLEQK